MSAEESNFHGRVAMSVAGGVADVRMARGDKLNALDTAMMDGLIAAGAVLHAMPRLRAVVLHGEGRGFCAGLDLVSMGDPVSLATIDLMARSHGNANRFQQVALTWRALPVPVIAAVHGVCFGGGLQIAAGADIRIAAPDARLAVMEMKWGIIPDMGGFALWRGRVREDVLRELTYSARAFSGTEGAATGFVTRTADDPLAEAHALAATIAAANPHAVRAAKQLFNAAPDLGFDAILLDESRLQGGLLGSANQIEAVRSGMEKRDGAFIDP